MLRPDLFEIASRATAMGFYVGLSTNGTLIDAPMADRIAAQGFDYVGISPRRLREMHDRFPPQNGGAFDASLAAVRAESARGVKVGLRYMMTDMNAADLPALLQLDARRAGRQVLLFAPELRRPRQHPPRPRRALRGDARRAGPAVRSRLARRRRRRPPRIA